MPQTDESNVFMTCLNTGSSSYQFRKKISLEQVGDSIGDCKWELDEVCAWKKVQRSTYSDPFDPSMLNSVPFSMLNSYLVYTQTGKN